MRQRAITAACLLAVAGLALAGCDGDGGTDDISGAAASVSATPTAAPTTTEAALTGQLPNLTGMPLLAARTMANDAGFTQIAAHDATGAERTQVSDGDWKVCFQQPGQGPAALSDPVDLAVVKIAEICPPADGTPAPSPTPTVTRTPAPSPTATHKATPKPRPTTVTHKPTPKPKPKPKPKPTVGYTEPPVNDHDGATALCNDGTLSYSQHHRGTCSHHHGVAVWYK
ncbi:DUF3761 domain-containing protein [Streptomyces sp. NPDC008139]|uniref:DUF3761 domain-containing protein n=1 Tax=Streptomyces sp. NPDC008139 TaxID=3364814 RepID=UPI0036EC6D52